MKQALSGLFLALGLGFLGAAIAADMPSYDLMVKDGYFTPTTIEVPVNTKFKLVVKNAGQSAEEFESHDLKREKVIPAGKSAEIVIGPLKAGTYNFVGEYHEKTAKGQIVAK